MITLRASAAGSIPTAAETSLAKTATVCAASKRPLSTPRHTDFVLISLVSSIPNSERQNVIKNVVAVQVVGQRVPPAQVSALPHSPGRPVRQASRLPPPARLQIP